MKYNQKLVDEMAQWVSVNGLIEYGGAKFIDFCNYFAIDTETYYRWTKRRAEFADAIKKAKDTFKKNLTQELVVTLALTAKGGQPYVKTKKRKEYLPNDDGSAGELARLVEDEETGVTQPNVGAAIFLITNLDPDHWQNKYKGDVDIRHSLKQEQRSREEILADIKRLEENKRVAYEGNGNGSE